MNIPLPQELQDYVSGLIESGRYSGLDEVLQEALREHQVRHAGGELVMTPELERLLDEGLENLDLAKDTDELRRS
jgi:putative addiction module CopG family antidote